MKIQCPNCKRKDFETTKKYNPDLPPNGSMVKSLLPYQIDWLCSSTTKGAEMTCPECLAALVVKGRLTIIQPTHMETEEEFTDKIEKMDETKVFICDECGKQVKSALGLLSHKRSHTGVIPYANVEV